MRGRPFQKGEDDRRNLSGRGPSLPPTLRRLAREDREATFKRLAQLRDQGDDLRIALAAATVLAEYGDGKTGPAEEGDTLSEEALRIEEERSHEEERRRRDEEEAARARRAFARTLQRSTRARPVQLRLTRIDDAWTLHVRYSEADLTKWWLGDEHKSLSRRNRLLLIHGPTRRLAWVAVNQTRLTQFGTSVAFTKPIEFETHRIFFEVTFTVPGGAGTNLRLRFGPRHRSAVVETDAIFSLGDLRFHGEPLISAGSTWPLATPLAQALTEQSEALRRTLTATMLAPFKYEKNRLGDQANQFLDSFSWRGPLALHNSEHGCPSARAPPFGRLKRA